MKHLAAALILLPTHLFAQAACTADTPPPEPCLVGSWIGQNTAGLAIQRFLDSMPTPPGTNRITIPGQPALLGMTIYEDGFYATLPLHEGMMWQESSEQDTVDVFMDLAIGSQLGHIWGHGGELKFCTTNEVLLLMDLEAISELSGSHAASIAPPGVGGFTPVMNYNCTADNLYISVQLPEPVGTIDYSMRRIDASRFDEEWQEILASRGEPVE